jgi:hypothetical protein
MASLPLGISVGVDGAAQAISTLGKISRNTRNINSGVIATGAAVARAFTGGIKFAARFGKQAVAVGADMAASARAGEEVNARFTDAGLAGAESLNNRMNELRDTVMSAFLNSLPHMLYYYDVAKARAIQFIATAVMGAQALWDDFDTIGANLGILGQWLFQNWKDVAYNIGQAWISSWIAQIETTKRLFTALKDWIAGRGWKFEGVGLMDNAKFRELQKPQFIEVKGLTEAISLQQDIAGEAIYQAGKRRDEALNATVRGPAKADEKKAGKTLGEALIRGSAAEASAKAQAIVQNQTLAIQRQQLAAQQRTARGVERLAGISGINITEARIA